MPTLIADLLDRFRGVVPSDAALSDGLGIPLADLEHVRAGGMLHGDVLEHLLLLDDAIQLLLLALEPSSAWKWLSGINAQLGDRQPLAALRRGDGDEVLRAASVVGLGSYS